MYSWRILRQRCKGHFVFFHSFILFKLRFSLRHCFSISIGFLFRCHCVCLNLPVSHIRIFCSCYTFNITKILEQLTYWFHERLNSGFSLFLQLNDWRNYSVIKDSLVYWHLVNRKYSKISFLFKMATFPQYLKITKKITELHSISFEMISLSYILETIHFS